MSSVARRGTDLLGKRAAIGVGDVLDKRSQVRQVGQIPQMDTLGRGVVKAIAGWGRISLFVCLSSVALPPPNPPEPTPPHYARQESAVHYAQEAAEICQQDGGMWHLAHELAFHVG